MIELKQLQNNLETASKRHHRNFEKFELFANFVNDQLSRSDFYIKGIGISLNLSQGFFSTTFVGRTLQFQFGSVSDANGNLIGMVTCYLKKEFPALEYISIGDFRFTGNGQTTLAKPEENDPIMIDDDIDALYIVLNYIHESLSR